MSENPRLNNARSKDFRYVYTNGITAQFGGHDFTLVFGIKEWQTSNDGKLFEEVGVVMTPTTAKMLAITLTKAVENFEKSSGNVILVDKAILGVIDKFVEAAKM